MCVGCEQSLEGQAGGRGGRSLQATVTVRKMGSHGRILSKGVTGSVLPLRTLPLAQIQRIELTEGLGTGRWVRGKK